MCPATDAGRDTCSLPITSGPNAAVHRPPTSRTAIDARIATAEESAGTRPSGNATCMSPINASAASGAANESITCQPRRADSPVATPRTSM